MERPLLPVSMVCTKLSDTGSLFPQVIKAEEGELPLVDLYMEREDEEGRIFEDLVLQLAEEELFEW
jgi:hypothetical protein